MWQLPIHHVNGMDSVADAGHCAWHQPLKLDKENDDQDDRKLDLMPPPERIHKPNKQNHQKQQVN